MKLDFAKLFLLLVSLFAFECVDARSWAWTGIELFGNKLHTREDILKYTPIQIGSEYIENPALWNQWCSDIKSKFNYYYTNCAARRYFNGEAYLVVDVVELDDAKRATFRTNPNENIEFSTHQMVDLHNLIYERMWKLFEQGINLEEKISDGYTDYSDPEMHEMAVRLSQIVPKHIDNLFEVLEKDRDEEKRAIAADLLCWSVNNIDLSILRANTLLNDPSSLVRNNLSRFTVSFISSLKSQKDRFKLIDNVFIQLDRPSFEDRNKAIYNLLNIALRYPEDRSYIKLNGFSIINKIATTSILSNVQKPAKELIELL